MAMRLIKGIFVQRKKRIILLFFIFSIFIYLNSNAKSSLFTDNHIGINFYPREPNGNIDAFRDGGPILVIRKSDSLKDCDIYQYEQNLEVYFSQNKDGSKKYDTPLSSVNEKYFLGFSCIPKNQDLAKFTFSYAILPDSKTYWVNENNFDLGTKNNYYGKGYYNNACINICYDIFGKSYKDNYGKNYKGSYEWEKTGLKIIQKTAEELPESAWQTYTINIKDELKKANKAGAICGGSIFSNNIFTDKTLIINISQSFLDENNNLTLKEPRFFVHNYYYCSYIPDSGFR